MGFLVGWLVFSYRTLSSNEAVIGTEYMKQMKSELLWCECAYEDRWVCVSVRYNVREYPQMNV